MKNRKLLKPACLLFISCLIVLNVNGQSRSPFDARTLIGLSMDGAYKEYITSQKVKEVKVNSQSDIELLDKFDKKGRLVESANVRSKRLHKYNDLDTSVVVTVRDTKTEKTFSHYSKADGDYDLVYSLPDTILTDKRYHKVIDGIEILISYNRMDQIKEKHITIRDEDNNTLSSRNYNRDMSYKETRYERNDSVQYKIRTEYDKDGNELSYKKEKYKRYESNKESLINADGKAYHIKHFNDKGLLIKEVRYWKEEINQIDTYTYNSKNKLEVFEINHLGRQTKRIATLYYDSSGLINKYEVELIGYRDSENESKLQTYSVDFLYY